MRQSFLWGVVTTLLATNIFQYWCVADANQRGKGLAGDSPSIASIASRESSVVRAVKVASPSVVAITTEVATQNPFSWMASGTASSEGSGVVIDSGGVVHQRARREGAIAIEATFSDDRTFEAEVIGLAPELDLAVLRLVKQYINGS